MHAMCYICNPFSVIFSELFVRYLYQCRWSMCVVMA